VWIAVPKIDLQEVECQQSQEDQYRWCQESGTGYSTLNVDERVWWVWDLDIQTSAVAVVSITILMACAVHFSDLNSVEPVLTIVNHVVAAGLAHWSDETSSVAHSEGLVASILSQAGVAVDVAREVSAVVEVQVQLLKHASCLVVQSLPVVVPVPGGIVHHVGATERGGSEGRRSTVLEASEPGDGVVGAVRLDDDVEGVLALLWVSSASWDLDVTVLAWDAVLGPLVLDVLGSVALVVLDGDGDLSVSEGWGHSDGHSLGGGSGDAVESQLTVVVDDFGGSGARGQWDPSDIRNDEVVADAEWLVGASINVAAGDGKVNLVSWGVVAGVNSEHFRADDGLGSIVLEASPIVGLGGGTSVSTSSGGVNSLEGGPGDGQWVGSWHVVDSHVQESASGLRTVDEVVLNGIALDGEVLDGVQRDGNWCDGLSHGSGQAVAHGSRLEGIAWSHEAVGGSRLDEGIVSASLEVAVLDSVLPGALSNSGDSEWNIAGGGSGTVVVAQVDVADGQTSVGGVVGEPEVQLRSVGGSQLSGSDVDREDWNGSIDISGGDSSSAGHSGGVTHWSGSLVGGLGGDDEWSVW